MFVYELSGCGFESSCSHTNTLRWNASTIYKKLKVKKLKIEKKKKKKKEIEKRRKGRKLRDKKTKMKIDELFFKLINVSIDKMGESE